MAAVQRKTSPLCARAHRPLAQPAAYSHAETCKQWQRVPHSAHAWLLDLPNVKPATRGAPPRTLPMGKGPLLSPQKGGEDPQPPPPKGGWGNFPPGGERNNKAEQSSEEHSRAEQMLQLFPRSTIIALTGFISIIISLSFRMYFIFISLWLCLISTSPLGIVICDVL